MKPISILLILIWSSNIIAQINPKLNESVEFVYSVTQSDSLKAYLFYPSNNQSDNGNPSIVIFHGGGWTIGEPSWAFGLAETFAQKGMVAIAAQFRLSNQKSITPIDAMEDARNVIIWMRKNAKELNIDSDRIVAYGWSSGAHLAASSAVFPSIDPQDSISSTPNALILYSPALSLGNDQWFRELLLEQGNPLNYSPAEHLKANMPPSIIVVGKDDTVTPLQESELFHHNMLEYGNESYLFVYDGVGHLFTPSDQPDDGWPNPDKAVVTKAKNEIDLFLKKIGYID